MRTVKPGAYQAPGGTTMRTPHVHFRVTGAGCHDDIVQMYFAGEPLIEGANRTRARRVSARQGMSSNRPVYATPGVDLDVGVDLVVDGVGDVDLDDAH